MTFKNKALISMVTIVMSCVLAVVAVVVIFAVEQVTVTTNVNMSYTSTVVGAQYGLRYKNSTDNEYIYVDQNVDISSEGASPIYATSDISNAKIVLNENNPYCVICWEFKNVGGYSFSAVLDYEDTGDGDEGVTITKVATTLSSVTDASIKTTLEDGVTNYFNTTISAGIKYYFYVKITMTSKYDDVEFTGNFNWVLTNIQPTQ